MSAPDFIPAEVRARLAGMRLFSRRAVQGHGFGLHGSRSLGSGMEFAQYRGYEPGDEPRAIDWKLFARSDRFYVREAERESPLTLWLLIDASASMAQCDHTRPNYSRLDAARSLAACAIELALRQGDRFGVIAVAGGDVTAVEAGSGSRQRDRCLLALAGLRAGGSWAEAPLAAAIWRRIPAHALVLMLGDGFDEIAIELSERLAAANREVIDIRILTAEERDFPFRGGIRFRDPETGVDLLSDGEAVRADFLRAFGAARSAYSARLAAAGILATEHVLDEPVDAPLRRLFGESGRSGRR